MIEELVLMAIKASVKAGFQIMQVYRSKHFNIRSKEDNTPVTNADMASHELIKNFLRKSTLPILSEEAANIPFTDRNNWDSYWLVDPLDGTKEFIKKNDEFSVNIALMKKQHPVAGIIYSPSYQDLYFSAPGKGVFKINCSNLIIDKTEDLSDLLEISAKLTPAENKNSITVITSKSHQSKEVKKYISSLKKKWPKIDLITKGSALKFGLIAEGKADVYPRFGTTMEWDTAAGHALFNELGFEVTDVETGKPLGYNKPDLRNPWFIAKNSRL